MDSIKSFFDKIYCINLDVRKDRLASFQKEMRKIWLHENDWERFSAISDTNWHRWCFLSHKKIVEISQKRGYKKILVFEDDIKIINHSYLLKSLQELQKTDWDIFYPGGTFTSVFPVAERAWKYLTRAHHLAWWFSIGYHQNIYSSILTSDVEEILTQYNSFDFWLAENIQKGGGCLRTEKMCISTHYFSSNIFFGKRTWKSAIPKTYELRWLLNNHHTVFRNIYFLFKKIEKFFVWKKI